MCDTGETRSIAETKRPSPSELSARFSHHNLSKTAAVSKSQNPEQDDPPSDGQSVSNDLFGVYLKIFHICVYKQLKCFFYFKKHVFNFSVFRFFFENYIRNLIKHVFTSRLPNSLIFENIY